MFNVNSKRPLVRSFPSTNNFVVIWIDDYSGKDEIYGRLFSSNGIPKDYSFLITDSSGMSNFFYLSMDMDSLGNYVVVWSAEVNSRWGIYWRWYDNNGEPLTGVSSLTDGTNQVSLYSDVYCFISNGGKIIVLWEQDEDNYSRIYAQRFNSNRTPIGKPFRVSSNQRAYYQLSARVILNNDNIYTFWGESGNGVWANVIDFNNPPITKINPHIPNKLKLHQNFPNPFNNSTTLTFYLSKSDYVVFNIYDISGKKISSLLNDTYLPGSYTFNWNSTNSSGMEVSSGVYFGELITSYGRQSIKMLLIQ